MNLAKLLISMIVLALPLTAITVLCWKGGPTAIQAQTQETAGELDCVSYCSPEQPGKSVIEIRWPLAAAPLPAAEVKQRMGQQTLEVSVYKDGFDRGLYATVPTVAPKTQFRIPPRPGDGTRAAPPRIPGLNRLVVTDVVTTGTPARAAVLRLSAAPTPGEAVVVRVAGVEPGMNYTWRLPTSAGSRELISCQAAICPVDFKRESTPSKSGPSKK
jgi:hypothetical protein